MLLTTFPAHQLAQTPTVDPLSPFMTALISLGGFGLLIVLLLTGWVVTKRAYDELRSDRDSWRRAYEDEHSLRMKLERSTDTVLEQGRLTIHLLEALNQGGQRGS